MVLQPPSCFGMMPNPEQCKFGKGVALKGPNILHSEWRASSKMDRFTKADCRLCAVCKLWANIANTTALSNTRHKQLDKSFVRVVGSKQL